MLSVYCFTDRCVLLYMSSRLAPDHIRGYRFIGRARKPKNKERYLNLGATLFFAGCVETSRIKDHDGLDLRVRTNPYNIRDNCSNTASNDVSEQQPCRRGKVSSSRDKI